jgi:transcription initiation factor TFIID subunit 13
MSLSTSKRKPKQRLFTKDVKSLLYAFGDVEEPLPDTVNAVEDILMNYVLDLCHDAHAYSKVTCRQKVRVDDFKFALRKDPYKYGRLEELLKMSKAIETARKEFDSSEGKSLKNVQIDEDEEEAGTSNGTLNDPNSTDKSRVSDKKATKSSKKDDNRPKRKYTKSGKERKPYKKRAKKGEAQGPVIMPAAPSKAV